MTTSVVIVLFVVLVVAVAYVAVPSGRELAAKRAVCDKAAATMMTTNDALELQRANVILTHVKCDVGRHLAEAGYAP